MKNKILFLGLMLIPLTTFAQSKVIKVFANKTRFTVQKIEGLQSGKKIIVTDTNQSFKSLDAGILECKAKTCLAEIISNPQNAQISAGSSVLFREKKYLWSAEVALINSLGISPSFGVYYNFPKDPWSLGLKYKRIATTISNIKLTGSLISLEAQRFLWSADRFQLWGVAELGLAKVDIDLSAFSTKESKIAKTARFIALGIDGRFSISERLKIVGGLGIVNDTLSQKFQGTSGEYKLETKPLNLTQKIGLLYFF